MISFVKTPVSLMLLSLFLLCSCTNDQGINSYLNDDQLLLKNQAAILKKWLSENNIENNQVIVFAKRQSNYKDFAITIIDKKIVSIRAKSVLHLASLSGLKNLDSLILYNALFRDFSGFVNCPQQLTELKVNKGELLDLSGLQNCNNLKLLSITNNKLKDLNGIKGFSNLIELDLSDNQINSLEKASILPQLQRLNLYGNSLKNLKGLKFFPSLIHLQVGGNDIEVLDVEYPLAKLETLKADKNPIKQLGQLKGLNNLLYLYVSYAQIKKQGLLELEKLELLDVSHNLIAELGELQPSASLKEINLNSNPITNLEPLLKWQQLKTIGIQDTNIDYLSLQIQEEKQLKMDGNFAKELTAKTMMKDYLKNNTFVKTAPSTSGTLYGINKSLTTFISLNSKSSIKGEIKIDNLKGVGHLKLYSFKDALMYGNQIDVKGKIKVKKGKLRLYTRINANFWTFASLVVKSQLREENPNKKVVESYHLDGYTFAEVDADNPQSFEGKFLTIGSELYLLLESVSDEVSGIEIMLD